MNWCKTCGAYLYRDPCGVLGLGHRCPPVWMVWEPMNEDQDDATSIRADDAEAAAIMYRDGDPEDYDRADEITVSVRSADGEHTAWDVSVEMEPSYSASQVEAAP